MRWEVITAEFLEASRLAGGTKTRKRRDGTPTRLHSSLRRPPKKLYCRPSKGRQSRHQHHTELRLMSNSAYGLALRLHYLPGSHPEPLLVYDLREAQLLQMYHIVAEKG